MKMRKVIVGLLACSLSLTIFSSCDPEEEVQDVKVSKGIIVLNQGKYNANNSCLTYYDYELALPVTDLFENQNAAKLGDTGQDMILYGDKVYIAMYKSSMIHVINKAGFVIKQIPMLNESSQPSKPRQLTAHNGKVYISLYDGHVSKLDTTSLEIEGMVTVGPNPEGLAVANNKLYVANSGGMQAVKDSTLSVIDLSSFTVEAEKIKVGLNPNQLVVDTDGDLYLLSKGNYYDVSPSFQKINTTTKTVTTINGFKGQGMCIDDDLVYLYDFEYDANWQATNPKVIVYDAKNETLKSSNLISASIANITNTPYSIAVDPIKKYIYIGTTDYVNNGKATCFDSTGAYKFSFICGVNPSKMIFLVK